MNAFWRKCGKAIGDGALRIGVNEMAFIQAFPFLAIIAAVAYPMMFGMGCGVPAARAKSNLNAMKSLCLQIEAAPEHLEWLNDVDTVSAEAWSERAHSRMTISGIRPSNFIDVWQEYFIISVSDGGVAITSSGPDRRGATDDDMRVRCAEGRVLASDVRGGQ